MKCVLFLCLVLLGFSLAQKSPDCPDYCDSASCLALSESSCIAETTLDSCGCCLVCSKVLNERCGGQFWQDGRCGADYICVVGDAPSTSTTVQVSVEDGEIGLCKCRSDNERVCGTDDVVYPSQCALDVANRRQEMIGQQSIIKAQDGSRCKYAPIINTRPKDTKVYMGQQLYLSCEVEGNPIPDVTWYRDAQKMPGYRGNIGVQIRGGQGKYRQTSWIMVETTEDDSGVYQCHAMNKLGEVYADATVSVSRKRKPNVEDEEEQDQADIEEQPANRI